MRAAADDTNELRALRTAWRAFRPTVRKRFLDQLLAPLFSEGETKSPLEGQSR
jgi:hypothetical protein